MRNAAVLLTLSFVALTAQGQPPAPAPPPPKTAPQAPPPPARAASPTRATMTVLVTDRLGKGLGDVEVSVTGPAERDGTTDAEGNVAFRNLGSGTYRLRF